MVRQKSQPLLKSVQASHSKALLKKKRLSEDLLNAENSEKYRLYGELLTANLHLVKPGDRRVRVINYYDGSEIEIPLDEKISASANAQKIFQESIQRPGLPYTRSRPSLRTTTETSNTSNPLYRT